MTRLFRFSLGFLFLFITLACVSVAYYRTAKENLLLRNELVKLKKIGGFIDIQDPENVYVLPIEPAGHSTWRFRLYLPAGQEYSLHYAPTWLVEGFPKPTGQREIVGTGEQSTLTVSVFKRPVRDRQCYGVTVAHGSGQSSQYFYREQAEPFEWISDQRGFSALDSFRGRQHELKANTAIEVLRHRAYAVEREHAGPKNRHLIPSPAPGFMVWLVPKSDTTMRDG